MQELSPEDQNRYYRLVQSLQDYGGLSADEAERQARRIVVSARKTPPARTSGVLLL